MRLVHLLTAIAITPLVSASAAAQSQTDQESEPPQRESTLDRERFGESSQPELISTMPQRALEAQIAPTAVLEGLMRLPADNGIAQATDLVLVMVGENLDQTRLYGVSAPRPAVCDDRCEALWQVYASQLSRAAWTVRDPEHLVAVIPAAMTREEVYVGPEEGHGGGADGPVTFRREDFAPIESNLALWTKQGFLSQPLVFQVKPKVGASIARSFNIEGTVSADGDGDGVDAVWAGGTDCDDRNPARYPGNTELPNNAIDDDCDLTVD